MQAAAREGQTGSALLLWMSSACPLSFHLCQQGAGQKSICLPLLDLLGVKKTAVLEWCLALILIMSDVVKSRN